jgi:hypothetical protein
MRKTFKFIIPSCLTLLGIVFSCTTYPSFGTQFEPYPEGKLRIVRDDLFELHIFPGWFKPLCDQKQYKGSSRLVVQLMSDGSAILNPSGELGFPPNAIDLNGLSLENAKIVWGEPRGMTFDLICMTRGPEMDVYHLDTKFVDGKLNSYRLRGIGISKPAWISLE